MPDGQWQTWTLCPNQVNPVHKHWVTCTVGPSVSPGHGFGCQPKVSLMRHDGEIQVHRACSGF